MAAPGVRPLPRRPRGGTRVETLAGLPGDRLGPRRLPCHRVHPEDRRAPPAGLPRVSGWLAFSESLTVGEGWASLWLFGAFGRAGCSPSWAGVVSAFLSTVGAGGLGLRARALRLSQLP